MRSVKIMVLDGLLQRGADIALMLTQYGHDIRLFSRGLNGFQYCIKEEWYPDLFIVNGYLSDMTGLEFISRLGLNARKSVICILPNLPAYENSFTENPLEVYEIVKEGVSQVDLATIVCDYILQLDEMKELAS